MYQAKCLCGQVHIEIVGKVSDIIHCHCSLCRKNSGTAFATNGFVLASEFNITQGADVLSTFSFKPGRHRHFCSCCGSPIFSSNEADPSRIRIRLGIIDSDITEHPISHNFITSKANWENLHAQLPRYETFEPNRN